MTVGELVAMLQRKMATDPAVRERAVYLEGCDCAGECVGISTHDKDLWLRRDDGLLNADVPIEEGDDAEEG